MFDTIVRLRIVAMLLCALVVVSVTAAPAPVYKHRPSRVWFDGWDDPIDKAAGCKVTRKGEKLTLSVAGSNREPGLLRDVEGDFVLEVRVSGEFHSAGVVGVRKAGVVVQFGGTRVRMDRVTETGFGTVSGGFSSEWSGTDRDGGHGWRHGAQDASSITHFRVRRIGNKLILEAREDEKGEWNTWSDSYPILTLPKKIKIGVSAEATAPGPFNVEFDQFRLTKPAK